MGKHIHRFILHSIVYISLLLSSNLYAGGPLPTRKLTDTDYRELCNIYKEFTNKPVNMNATEGELLDAIDSKLPDLLNELFTHAMLANPEDRYNFIKEYAKGINKITWECEAARQYYINDTKKSE